MQQVEAWKLGCSAGLYRIDPAEQSSEDLIILYSFCFLYPSISIPRNLLYTLDPQPSGRFTTIGSLPLLTIAHTTSYRKHSAPRSQKPHTDTYLIRIIHLLVLRIRRDQRKIPWRQILPLLPAVAHNCPVARVGEYNGILAPVMMDCGRCVRLCDHSRGADVFAAVYDCVLADHAVGLRARDDEGGGGGVLDWELRRHGECFSFLFLSFEDGRRGSGESRLRRLVMCCETIDREECE